MTRFERDIQDALEGNEIEVLKRRADELDRILEQLRCCNNGFRRKCLRQEWDRLKAQYDKIDEMF